MIEHIKNGYFAFRLDSSIRFVIAGQRERVDLVMQQVTYYFQTLRFKSPRSDVV